MEIRSFLAFELPQNIKAEVSDIWQAGRRTPLEIKWVPPNNIHLTVVFLGNIQMGRVGELEEKVESVCAQFDPFEINLEGLGIFGNRRHPRVLWLGLGGEVPRMGQLRDALQKNLKPFGIKPENRPFRPHLTLGRFRKNAQGGSELDRMRNQYGDFNGPAALLEELVLFKSDLTPKGAVYTQINKWNLS